MARNSQHDFVIVIPVADRPQHLQCCLDSLLALCRQHPYAGRVSALIADDSRDANNIAQIRAIAEACTARGLGTHHLDQAEQRALVGALPSDMRARLAGVLGDGAAWCHKGASITRNLAYLWLNRLQRDGRPRLYWFVDSDQEFRVNLETAGGEEAHRSLDYLHWLDRIFCETPARILTGKVVGDPPVSPAVMAGNFLGDVLDFLGLLGGLDPAATCSFHGGPARQAHDAAYHDMAELFGFRPAAEACRYRCPLQGDHDHARCLAAFAERLNRFFDGEHPTRRNFYRPGDPRASLQPARTVYTGNYVLTPEALAWFIPFAALRLRMAGPTLGRILRAELGAGFVSANLPLLHRRTVGDIGQSEFRPGIDRGPERIDLTGEFERQYFGDVTLFAMERLTALGYPARRLPDPEISSAVDETDAGMHARYQTKRGEIAHQIEQLRALFQDRSRWWQQAESLTGAREAFDRFIEDMQGNFAAQAPVWRLLGSTGHRAERKADIVAAIGRYHDERAAWAAILRQP